MTTATRTITVTTTRTITPRSRPRSRATTTITITTTVTSTAPIAATTTLMTASPLADEAPGSRRVLLQLMRLASPSLPVGGFSYSEGLESAVEHGLVGDEASALRLARRPAPPRPRAVASSPVVARAARGLAARRPRRHRAR